MLKHVDIDKEKYLNKSKAEELKAYIHSPSTSVLLKKVAGINDIVRKMAMNRR